MRIEVAYSAGPRTVDVVELELAVGSTVGDAVLASGLRLRHPALPADLTVGVWGQRCGAARLLIDGDRVELYRPLQTDPKDARRTRSQRQAAHRVRGTATRR